eukprot:4206651-Amphidinium_carterae.1
MERLQGHREQHAERSMEERSITRTYREASRGEEDERKYSSSIRINDSERATKTYETSTITEL